MKKTFLTAAVILMTITSFAKEVKLSESSKASALGQIADKNLAGKEATLLIKSILSGQAYENRVSIIDTICNKPSKSLLTTCNVQIGTDDMNDDDNGYGDVYGLRYLLDSKGTVIKASFSLIAG